MIRFLRFLLLASSFCISTLLCSCYRSAETRSDKREKWEATITKRGVHAIPELIQQLGSHHDHEREEASKTLEDIGFSALPALRNAAQGDHAYVARRATRLIEIIENSVDQLLADYCLYGLPLPPKDAKLVRFESGQWRSRDGKEYVLTYYLGFVLQMGINETPPLLLVGTQDFRLNTNTKYEAIDPKPEALKDFDSCYRWRLPFELNAGLATALQCKARGWNELAQELLTISLQTDCGHHNGAFYQRPNSSSRAAVAILAWAHYGNELVRPDTNRSLIAVQMKRLLSAHVDLKNDYNETLLKSLEATLVPSTAEPGSVEKLIDDLTEMCNTMQRRRGEKDPHYGRLEQLGLATVPILIEHLDDNRLTRNVRYAFNNNPPRHVTVKEVVSDLLQSIAGEDLGKSSFERRRGWVVEKADAQKWWEKAQKNR